MNEKSKDSAPRDMDTVRFFSLVSMFASSAYQAMGKISNPVTGKVERNLDGAQGMIDILLMLGKKTEGNLSEDEKRLLTSTITELQMNFVKEKEKPEPETEKEDEAEKPEEGAEEKKESDESAEEKEEDKSEKER